MQAAIEAHAVSQRTRAGRLVIRDVSLTVGPGELVAIIGGAGSGKTTLLEAMSGLRPPTSGTVIRCPGVAGRPGRFGRETGYVPSDAALAPVLPLGRALRYTARLRGTADGADPAGEPLGLTGLAAKAAVPVGALDPGERKRAVIAAELMSRPAQLFLDEPTAGLDPAQATEMLRLLRRLSGSGITVVLTTSGPVDAARCDKAAVLAAGGHLAFFGTPGAARGYFGADSMDEIYERLAGLGDPAAAWSRRFFHFARTRVFAAPVPTTPRAPGPAVLVPDAAGPLSAGRPGYAFAGGADVEDAAGAGREFAAEASLFAAPPAPVTPGTLAAPPGRVTPGTFAASRPAAPGTFAAPATEGGARGRAAPAPGPLPPVRQLPVLVARNAEVLARSALTRSLLAGAPLAVLLSFAVLTAAGAFDAPAAGAAWLVLGGFCLGLGYGFSLVREEAGVLAAERFAGLSAPAFVLAKALVLVPALAAADAVALLVPLACSRLAHGYGPAYVTVLLSSAVALALAFLFSAGRPAARRVTAAADGNPVFLPALPLAGAALTLLDRPAWPQWAALAALAAALASAAVALITRCVPAAPTPSGRADDGPPLPAGSPPLPTGGP